MIRRAAAAVIGGGIAVFAGVGGFDDDTARNDQGEIVEAGGLGAFSMRVGDCFDLPDAQLVQSVEGIPCDEPHDAEVTGSVLMADGPWPGPAQVELEAERECSIRFEFYIGQAPQMSQLWSDSLMPTEQTWTEIDDREILCLAGRWDGQKMTQSVNNSGL